MEKLVTVDFSQFVQNSSFVLDSNLEHGGSLSAANRNNLSDCVVDFVVNKILTGEYSPGSRIDPKNIAEELDISQMPIRDALEKLQERGWIIRYPQRGTFVKKVMYSDLVEMCQVRSMIETEAVRHIIENYNPLAIDTLGDIIDKNEQAIEAQDLEEYEKYDTLFHYKMVLSTGNSRMADLSKTVYNQTRYYFLVLVWGSLDVREHDIMNLRNIPVSHKSIFEAIERRDVLAATELLRSHIRKGVERCWQIAKMRRMVDEQ